MAAYAALVSVMQIIHQIQNHPSPPISLDKQQVESLTEIVTSLQEFLEGYNSPVADSDEADPLEMRIADAAYAAEDVIESNIVDRIPIQRNRPGFFNCFPSLKKPKNNGEKMDNVIYLSSDLGLHLPNPPRDKIVIMENLQTLTRVSNLKFDAEVVRRIPNIKKLGLLYRNDKGSTESHDDNYYCLGNIECLHKLESLRCAVDVRDFHFEKLSFPHSLKKLSLSVKLYNDLDDMLVKIGSLPLLEKLVLDGAGFRTGTWEVVEGQFPSLKFLSLTWISGLEMWTTESSPFPCLEHLRLDYLKDLKEIPTEIGEIPTLQSIVLKYCSESAVKSMKRIVEEQEDLQGDDLPFKVQVFLTEENEELQKLANSNFQVTVGVYRTDFF